MALLHCLYVFWHQCLCMSVSSHSLFWFCCFSLWSFFYLMPNFTILLFLFCFSLVSITFLPPLGDRGQLTKRQTYATVHTPYFFWMWLDIFLALAHIFLCWFPLLSPEVTTFTAVETWKWTSCLLEPCLCPLVFSWLFVVCCGFFFSSSFYWYVTERQAFFLFLIVNYCVVEMNIKCQNICCSF